MKIDTKNKQILFFKDILLEGGVSIFDENQWKIQIPLSLISSPSLSPMGILKGMIF